jgi:hypothetical protein
MNKNIIPIEDTIMHSLGKDCECCPTVEQDENGTVITHNAKDGREAVEETNRLLGNNHTTPGWAVVHSYTPTTN